MMQKTERLLTVTIAAKRLEVCRRTIRRWIKSGKLPATRYPSGHLRVSADLIARIERGQGWTHTDIGW